MNDYVTRRRSFKIFSIVSALIMSQWRKYSLQEEFLSKKLLFPTSPSGNFKIHKHSTLTKIHPIQNFYLELN